MQTHLEGIPFKLYTINGTANNYKNDNRDVDESENVCKDG